jgi:hypothetical protein
MGKKIVKNACEAKKLLKNARKCFIICIVFCMTTRFSHRAYSYAETSVQQLMGFYVYVSPHQNTVAALTYNQRNTPQR